jgi:uncharacterized protein YgiM (DUF1202 family)
MATERTMKTTSKKTVRHSIQSDIYTKPKKVVESKKTIYPYHSDDILAVDSEILNLRKGPGTEYEIIEILEKRGLLKLIAIDGEWLQVNVIETGNYGYVNAKFVYKT